MAKKHFSFEDDEERISKPKPSNKTSYTTSPYGKTKAVKRSEFHFKDEDHQDRRDPVVTAKAPAKKKKLKKWHVVLTVLVALALVGVVAVFIMTREDGPVYGDRCEGLQTISASQKSEAISKMKSKYSAITEMNMETACHTLKVDITFKNGTSAYTAESIAKATVSAVDSAAGKSKQGGSSYSNLFGTYQNVKQYEVNFYLKSSGKSYPIYGTKVAGNDEFNFTRADIRDNSTYKKVTSK